jgi:hypothetical protein
MKQETGNHQKGSESTIKMKVKLKVAKKMLILIF